MKHASQPAAIYDLATVVSTTARHNVRGFSEATARQLTDVHDGIVDYFDLSLGDKPPVPHTDPEMLKAAKSFAGKALFILQAAEKQGRMQHCVAEKTRSVIEKFVSSLQKLEGDSVRWLCDDREIDKMFGISVTSDDTKSVMHEETQRLADARKPESVVALSLPATEGEIQRLFHIIRSALFKASTIYPDLYTDPNSERHLLFWSTTAEKQECAVPHSYSLAEHFRFHCPHNDAHLSHLHDLSEHGVMAYTDFMDERAFFEAVAVLSEWQIFNALQKNDEHLSSQLHAVLEPEKRIHLSAQSFRQWMIDMRTYECRLRAARLVADVLTIQERMPFEEMIRRSMVITGLPREDVEAEARKYYFLPGLGAIYTLGYKRMLENGIQNPIAGFQGKETLRTWKQFQAQYVS